MRHAGAARRRPAFPRGTPRERWERCSERSPRERCCEQPTIATGEPLKVMDKPKGAPADAAAAGGTPAENKAQMLRRDSSVMLGALQQALGE